jgi:tetratricopeptide (TPR) repeat protein
VANPRIDDLRKKLDKEPASRLFAQLAEELRKDGDLAEAIRVARQGLGHHPNYPSARMTLGRALLDSGDLQAARKEFEAVLKGAADNILASRFLAECLEGLGQNAEALQRYKATLALAPGDKQVQARIQALEKAPSAVSAPPRQAEAAPAAAPARADDSEPPPIRVVEVDGPMELVTRYEEAHPTPPPPLEPADDIYIAPPAQGPRPEVAPEKAEAPVPLVPVDEAEFELERTYDAAPVVVRPLPGEGTPSEPARAAAPGTPLATVEDDEPVLEADAADDATPPAGTLAPAAQPDEAEAEPMLLEPDVVDEEFDVAPPTPPLGTPRVTFRDILAETGGAPAPVAAAPLEAEPVAAAPAPEPPAAAEPPAPAAAPPPAAPAVAPPAAAPPPELASPTLAELYFDQGFPEKAVEVYRRLLEREPDNERLRTRMREIEARTAAPAAAAAAWPPGSRQESIGRVIDKLHDLRAALARRD